MDGPSFPMESSLEWFRIVVIGAVVAVIIHFELPLYAVEFVRDTLWIPWRVSTQMRKQGHLGPPLGLFKDYAKELRELTIMAPTEPLLTSRGLSHDFEARVFTSLHAWRTHYGNNFIFKRGQRIHLHTCDPDEIKEILATNFDTYQKSTAASITIELLGPKGIVFAQHEEWAKQRRVVRPAFYQSKTREMAVEMASWIEMWLQKLDARVIEKGGSLDIDMQPELYELTRELLARIFFGSSFQKGKEGFIHMEKHKNLLVQRGHFYNPLQRWRSRPLTKKILKEGEGVLTCLQEIIRERRNCIQPGNYESYGDDFLGLLLADRDRLLELDGRPPGELETEDQQLTDQCRTFFFAAGDTVHSATLWAVMLLSFYTDWQDKIRDELQETFRGAPPNGAQLIKVKHLTMFLDETLRLYGPAPLTNREVYQSNTTLQGEPLPKTLVIQLNFFALHRDKENWGDDAMEFKPERFSNGAAQACKKPFAYLPFGWGPRTCVAQSFALTEVKLILAMLLQRFSFRLAPSYRHEPMLGFTLIPKFGVQVVLEQVKPASA